MFKNQKGLSIVELVVAVGISTAVVLGTSSLILQSVKDEQTSQSSLSLQSMRLQIQSSLNSTSGYQETLNRNPSMACFQNGTDCSPYSSPQNLVINIGTQSSPIILDGNNPGLGLTAQGAVCSNFSLDSSDATCIYGLTPRWQSVCESATACKNPQPKMSVSFVKKLNVNVPQAMPRLNITVYKDANLQSLSDVCTSMNGVLNGTSCSIPALNQNCNGTGQYILGFDANGVAQCGALPAQPACVGVLQGYASSGAEICAAACP